MNRQQWTDLLRRSRKRVDEARDELDTRRGAPPAPGDLFVLPEAAELPVEWAILDRAPGPPERLLAVPADANPLAGSADVEVPAGEPGGPLSLRCGYGVWIEPAAFDPERRTGVLTPAAVEEARLRGQEIERGEPSASSLALEADVDPEYQDWVADTLAPARTALEARSRTSKRPSGGRVFPFPGSGIHLLAATLAAACVGLSIGVAMLAQEVDRLSGPAFEVFLGDIALGGAPRGVSKEKIVNVPPDASRFMVMLGFDRRIEAGRLQIVAPDGEVLARSGLRSFGPFGELALSLPRRRFPDGRYFVRLRGPGGGLLDEVVLIVETEQEPS
ncbi:MAG: hypothetical protein ACLGI9_19980 [Thermoanaerobaculia bacterium]